MGRVELPAAIMTMSPTAGSCDSSSSGDIESSSYECSLNLSGGSDCSWTSSILDEEQETRMKLKEVQKKV